MCGSDRHSVSKCLAMGMTVRSVNYLKILNGYCASAGYFEWWFWGGLGAVISGGRYCYDQSISSLSVTLVQSRPPLGVRLSAVFFLVVSPMVAQKAIAIYGDCRVFIKSLLVASLMVWIGWID